MKLSVALSLLAAPVLAKVADKSIRGSENERELKAKKIAGWDEQLGRNGDFCKGAICGVWGDPHVITCDGLGYDCQGKGIFTIMKNHMFNIQGRFVDIREEDKSRVKHLVAGASLTNDIVVDWLGEGDYPSLQLSFGDLQIFDGTFLEEKGCTMKHYYNKKNGKRIKHPAKDVYECRALCESTAGCDRFTYWADYNCNIILDSDEAPLVKHSGSWNLGAAGTLVSECGVEHPPPEFKVEEEKQKHGRIGAKCPLLMYLDGELHDISDFTMLKKGFLYGKKEDDFSVEMQSSTIYVKWRLPSGNLAAATFNQRGSGPFERWGCNWHFDICLPAEEQDQFEANSVGILGTPNNNTQDDWMDVMGNTLPMNANKGNGKPDHQAAYDYCMDNWCVGPMDSILAYPGNVTAATAVCDKEDFIEFDVHDRSCVMEAQEIIDFCADMPPMMRYPCEIDCCNGGCSDAVDTIEEIEDIKPLSDEDEDIQYHVPDHSECDDEGFDFTGDSVCPDTDDSIVSILATTGDVPEDVEIIYGINLADTTSDGKHIKFRVNNPFDVETNIYVKKNKNEYVNDALFLAPSCDPMIETSGGCSSTAPLIEAACQEFEGLAPFAVVEVFFSSTELPASEGTIDKCCQPTESSEANVVSVTFEIACDCPGDVVLETA